MKKQTNGNEGQECPSERARAQLHRALRLLSGKWKGEILWQLVDGKQRFGQLRRAIPDVTQHMLTTQLRDLESEGLVKRTVFPEVPPRVEYALTPLGSTLDQIVCSLVTWSGAHLPEVDAARAAYDAKKGNGNAKADRL